MSESLAPQPQPSRPPKVQPSLFSLPSAACTVAPNRPSTLPRLEPGPGARRRLWFFTALSMLACVAGAAALGSRAAEPSAHVRSGSPGFRHGHNGRVLHWNQPGVTIYLDASLDRIGGAAREGVIRAFGNWLESSDRIPSISFDSGGTSALPVLDGKSTVSYGRITAPGHERDLAITVTYADEESGEIREADVVLNSMYPMAVLTAKGAADATADGKSYRSEAADCGDRYDVENALTHEAGHFFGLGEDLVERGATMFPTIDQCEVHKRVLASTDRAAVSELYAQFEAKEEAGAGPRACSFGAPPRSPATPVAASLALSLGLLLLSRRRR